MGSLPIEQILIEAERQKRQRESYLSHWVKVQEQESQTPLLNYADDELDETATQLVYEMLDYLAVETAALDCFSLIYDAEVHREQQNYCKLLLDKLKWVNLQLRALESEHETMGLRQLWEILQQRIRHYQQYLDHCRTALAVLRRSEAIHFEILTFSCCLQNANTEPADMELEVETVLEQLGQMADHIEALNTRGYDVATLLAAYQERCEELDLFCENLDA